MRQTELISSSDFLGPSLALLAVLLIFMVCVWAIKMLQKQTVHDNDRLRIVSG